MTLTKQEWKRLHWPLGMLIVSILAMAASVHHTQSKVIFFEAEHAKQERLLKEAKQKLQLSGQEKETITTFLPQYQRLIDIGFVGEEKRIEWLDALRNVHDQSRLFKVDYMIDKQSAFKTTLPIDLGPFVLYTSIMNISLEMLHEGDIITLLEGLNANAHAPYILRQCEIRRLTNQFRTDVMQPSFQAICELDWMTLHEPLATAGGGV